MVEDGATEFVIKPAAKPNVCGVITKSKFKGTYAFGRHGNTWSKEVVKYGSTICTKMIIC